jgi:hypothetical protein
VNGRALELLGIPGAIRIEVENDHQHQKNGSQAVCVRQEQWKCTLLSRVEFV